MSAKHFMVICLFVTAFQPTQSNAETTDCIVLDDDPADMMQHQKAELDERIKNMQTSFNKLLKCTPSNLAESLNKAQNDWLKFLESQATFDASTEGEYRLATGKKGPCQIDPLARLFSLGKLMVERTIELDSMLDYCEQQHRQNHSNQ